MRRLFHGLVLCALRCRLMQSIFKFSQIRVAGLGSRAHFTLVHLCQDLGKALVHLRHIQLILIKWQGVDEFFDGTLAPIW